MSKKLIGLIMVICGIAAFHLMGSQPETAALWTTYVDNKIYSDPIQVKDKYVFLGGNKGKRSYQLYEVDTTGNVSAESVKMPVFPYTPINFDGIVVVADRSNMIRGFSVPGLKIAWESGTQQPITFEPTKAGKENFLVPSGKDVIYCINSNTGQPVWDYKFNKTLTNFGADEIVACITGYSDLKNPSWSLSAHSVEDGELLWNFEEPVSSDKPLFIQGLCITTTANGQLIVLNQHTGQVVYRHPAEGLKAVQILDDRLILLAASGSRVICLSLMTGESWATTLNSDFTGAAKYGNKLVLATKKSVRCVNVNNGALFWNRNLGDIYNAYPFRKGIFLSHKDSFFDRTTYGSYLSAEDGNPIWTTYGKSLILKPLISKKGDLVTSYNGMVRMLPTPTGSDPETTKLPDGTSPEDKIEFWKSSSASDTKKIETDKGEVKVEKEKTEVKNSVSPKEKKDPNLSIKETGWVSDGN